MQATHHIRSIEPVTSGPRSESLFHTQNTNFIDGAIEPVDARVLFETRAYLLSEVKRGVGNDSVR